MYVNNININFHYSVIKMPFRVKYSSDPWDDVKKHEAQSYVYSEETWLVMNKEILITNYMA